MRLRLDHLAVAGETLEAAVAHVEEVLGVAMQGGGRHELMATHNRLLGMGDLYLEAIAADPDRPRPAWPRWFDLDRFSGPARLTNWVAECGDLAAGIAASPPGVGVATALARGDYRWQMAVPADGVLPFGGAFPALIQWQGDLHPARALPDSGCRLAQLVIAHPEVAALRAALAGRLDDPRLVLTEGALALSAEVDTPRGRRVL